MFYVTKSPVVAPVEIKSIISPQMNTSSVGDTYLDVAGNTYAETVNQTRAPLHATRLRHVCGRISALVTGGIGTFQLWNATDSTALGTQTTNALAETILDEVSSCVASNMGDEITIRLKNNTAGQSMTIVSGGIVSGDLATAVWNTTNGSMLAELADGYIKRIQFGFIKVHSAATFTAQLRIRRYTGACVESVPFGTICTEADCGNVITVDVPYKPYMSSIYGVFCSAIVQQIVIPVCGSLQGDPS